MSERMEEISLLLILAYCLCADGLMNTLGLSGFALASAIIMAAVAALRYVAVRLVSCDSPYTKNHSSSQARGKEKAPYTHADQSQM